MKLSRSITALAIATLGTLAVVGCGSNVTPEAKGGTTSHLESDDVVADQLNPGDPQADNGDERDNGGNDGDDSARASGDQQAFAPAVYIAFVVAAAVVGAIATCSAAN